MIRGVKKMGKVLDDVVLGGVIVGSAAMFVLGLGGCRKTAPRDKINVSGKEEWAEALGPAIEKTVDDMFKDAIAEGFKEAEEERKAVIKGDYSSFQNSIPESCRAEGDYLIDKLNYMDGSIVAEAKAKNPGLNEDVFKKNFEQKLKETKRLNPAGGFLYISFKAKFPEWAEKHDPLKPEEKEFLAFTKLHNTKCKGDNEHVKYAVSKIPMEMDYDTKKKVFYNRYRRENPKIVAVIDDFSRRIISGKGYQK